MWKKKKTKPKVQDPFIAVTQLEFHFGFSLATQASLSDELSQTQDFIG
jgi:hypothetical protein